jgi:uncharacterized membrane protein YqaE (UPF0057 family)
MGILNSSILFYNTSTHADAMANRLMLALRYDGYEVDGIKLPSGEWDISVKKGNLFKAVLGLQTALKVKVTNLSPHVCVTTDVGIFGQQAIPTILTVCVWWPFIITQIWGLIKQYKLDQYVMNKVLDIFTDLSGHTIVTKTLS